MHENDEEKEPDHHESVEADEDGRAPNDLLHGYLGNPLSSKADSGNP